MDSQDRILERLEALERQVRTLHVQLEAMRRKATGGPADRDDEAGDKTLASEPTGLDAAPPTPDYRIRKNRKEGERAPRNVRLKAPSASAWMAWGAGIAFVLAAVYFIKIVYDFGWLTPERQIGLAIASGIALIGGGLLLSRSNKDYAAFLPAAGIIILYLSIYSAHLFYDMIGVGVVIFAIGATTIASIWLDRHFDNTAYAMFAVVGAYSFPLLIQPDTRRVIDLVIYFAAWSLLFSFISLQERKRIIYMLAMLLAIIGFDVAWRMSDADSWIPAMVYQFVQFIAFSATAVWYSAAHRDTMSRTDAVWHAVALFYFYVVEYITVKQHAPDVAPMAALASAAVVFAAYLIAGRLLSGERVSTAGAALVSLYCTSVTTHILFFELIPTSYLPWATLLMIPGAFLVYDRLRDRPEIMQPILIAALFMIVVGLNLLLADGRRSEDLFMPGAALFAYSAMLYFASRRVRLAGRRNGLAVPLLYAGHVTFMVATVRVFESGLTISIVWGVFAVVLLLIALRLRNRILGQSSLIVFAASGLKVLLYDLTGTPSLVRVLTLVVLGATLYAGGWMYQRIAPEGEEGSGDGISPRVDA